MLKYILPYCATHQAVKEPVKNCFEWIRVWKEKGHTVAGRLAVLLEGSDSPRPMELAVLTRLGKSKSWALMGSGLDDNDEPNAQQLPVSLFDRYI